MMAMFEFESIVIDFFMMQFVLDVRLFFFYK